MVQLLNMGYESFVGLEVWKKARELKKEIGQLVKSFPSIEMHRLADQLIRSSRSINALVAEGHGTWQDRCRFCVMARGSLSETLNHLIDAFDELYISKEQLKYFRNKIAEVEMMLNGYISFLSRKARA